MKQPLDETFFNSIIWISSFQLSKTSLNINVLTIEENNEVAYNLIFHELIYFTFRQENQDDEFSVIDVFLEKFNDCPYVEFMKSELRNDYWAMRFHSGIHHIVVGFKTIHLIKL